MIAHAMIQPMAVMAQGGKRNTAVSNDSSRIAQCRAIIPAVAVRVLTEHSPEHSTGDREIGCPKKHPGNANRAVSSEAGKDSNERRVRP